MNSQKNVKTLENPSNSEFLIDTSILIDYSKKKAIEELIGNSISVITLIEFLRYFKDEQRREKLKNVLEEMFNIVGIDNDVILTYCELYQKLKSSGELIEDADLLIASTAIAKKLILWTKNIRHFERLKKYGLKIIKTP